MYSTWKSWVLQLLSHLLPVELALSHAFRLGAFLLQTTKLVLIPLDVQIGSSFPDDVAVLFAVVGVYARE